MDTYPHLSVSRLCIDDYRGITHLALDGFHPQMNLLVGANGAGKTTVLDAMAVLLSRLVTRLTDSRNTSMALPGNDVRLGCGRRASLSLSLASGAEWRVVSPRPSSDTSRRADLTALSALTKEWLSAGAAACRPVIAYYRATRTLPLVKPKVYSAKQARRMELPEAFNGLYEKVWGNPFSELFRWYRNQEDIENERCRDDASYRDPSLAAVRTAIAGLFTKDEGWGELRVSRRPLALTIRKRGETLNVNSLSEGEKCYLSLVCDIAKRLGQASNGSGNPLEGEGVILIDEVDLHLHPRWQMEVLGRLTRIFPRCQFFATTHSPLVVSDNPGRTFLIDAQAEDVASAAFETGDEGVRGKTSTQILCSLFGVAMPRSHSVQSLIDLAYRHLQSGDEEEYLVVMEQLVDILGENDEAVTALRIDRRRREFLASQQKQPCDR